MTIPRSLSTIGLFLSRRPPVVELPHLARSRWQLLGTRLLSTSQEPASTYAVSVSTAPTPSLARAVATTRQQFPHAAHMLLGETSRQLLQHIVYTQRAQRVLELGTFTGVTTLALCQALPAGAKVVTVDRDERALTLARTWLNPATVMEEYGVDVSIVHDQCGAYLQSLSPDRAFDLILMDADKRGQLGYLETVLERGLLAAHGIVVIDNTLFRGLVYQEDVASTQTKRVAAIAKSLDDLNHKLASDRRLCVTQLPIDDGVTLVRQSRIKE